jgi:hypothetical protein
MIDLHLAREGIPVSTSARETNSTDATLAAIKQALEQFARVDESRSRPEDQISRLIEPASSPSVETDEVSSGRRLRLGKAAVWIGFLAIVCVGAIIFAWRISDGRSARSTATLLEAPPAPTSATAMAKEPITTQAISSIAATRIDKSPEQPTVQPQAATKPAEPAVSIPPELTQKIQMLEVRLTGLAQGIEQIRTDQARLARESSELQGTVREMQEKLFLRVQELASEVKATEEKAAQDRLTAAEQLRVNQEQLARIGEQLRASQEQIDHRKSGTQRRVARLAPPQPQPSNAPVIRKPAPKPQAPQAGVLPAQSSRPSQAR